MIHRGIQIVGPNSNRPSYQNLRQCASSVVLKSLHESRAHSFQDRVKPFRCLPSLSDEHRSGRGMVVNPVDIIMKGGKANNQSCLAIVQEP